MAKEVCGLLDLVITFTLDPVDSHGVLVFECSQTDLTNYMVGCFCVHYLEVPLNCVFSVRRFGADLTEKFLLAKRISCALDNVTLHPIMAVLI